MSHFRTPLGGSAVHPTSQAYVPLHIPYRAEQRKHTSGGVVADYHGAEKERERLRLSQSQPSGEENGTPTLG